MVPCAAQRSKESMALFTIIAEINFLNHPELHCLDWLPKQTFGLQEHDTQQYMMCRHGGFTTDKYRSPI
jgi:hypothetical protein